MALEEDILNELSRKVDLFQHLSPRIIDDFPLEEKFLFSDDLVNKYKDRVLDGIACAHSAYLEPVFKFAWDNKQLISAFYKNSIISDAELETSIQSYICNQAKRDYDFLVKAQSNRLVSVIGSDAVIPYKDVALVPDAGHLMNPKAFAHALVYRHFSENEEKNIMYDVDDSKESFIMRHFDLSYPQKLKEGVLHPIKPVLFPEGSAGSSDNNLSHCCGHF
jgi:hypothetical protein